MAKVGIFETAPRQYFPYDVDTEVELEFINKERMGKIVKKAEEIARKMKQPQGAIFDMLLGKAAVTNWRHKNRTEHPDHPGLVLPSGAPIAFTAENRDMLMQRCAEFSGFVFSRCTDSAGYLAEDEAPVDQKSLSQLIAEIDLEDEPEKNG